MDYSRPPPSAFSTPRRVFTAPTALSTPQQSQNNDGVVETLYNHPSVKIVSFNAGPRLSFSPGRGITSPVEVEPGTLPWSSQLERTIAVGPFRIYRAPGSVAFLSCGSALQPILPKSQCWCIDEASSKFILQIRRPQYWRIEVPVGEAEKDRRAQLLREVFDKVLQFEKTPCPFMRAFTVELPERPQTPVKKRPWTPVTRAYAQLPPTPVTPSEATSRFRSGGPRRITTAEGGDKSSCDGSESDPLTPAVPLMDKIELFEKDQDRTRGEKQEIIAQYESLEGPGLLPAMPGRLTSFQASRSVTAPPQLTLNTSPPSKIAAKTAEDQSSEATESHSPTESSDSFHSIQSWHSPITPLPPSPPLSNPNSPKTFPYPHDNILLPNKSPSHQRDVSDATITPITQGTWELSPTGAEILTIDATSESSSIYQDAEKPSLDLEDSPTDDHETIDDTREPAANESLAMATSTATTPRPQIRHRATTSSISVSRHRALSPLPSAANLFTPHRRFRRYNSSNRAATRLEAVRRIPTAIIHKTCEILLSPPSHLIALMLKVAARIAAGEWRGFMFGTGDSGENIPVQWDYSDDDLRHWDDDDDDYCLERVGRIRSNSENPSICRRQRDMGGPDVENRVTEPENDWSRSWEVD